MDKKLIYLLFTKQSEKEKSVYKKIHEQTKALRRLGIETKIFTFNLCDNQLTENQEFNHISILKKSHMPNIIQLIINYKLTNRIFTIVKKENPDFIYLRDCMFFNNLHYKLSKISHTFVEIQTDIMSELKLFGGLRFRLEIFLKRKYLKHVKGIIPITKEIQLLESKFNRKPYYILGNGIDAAEIEFIPKYTDNGYINLLFIGTPDCEWHGVERLIESYKYAPNKKRFKLHIIGYEKASNFQDSNIIFYGFIKDPAKIRSIFSISDIGIGTLALYKKRMKEAAPLKTRHYLAKGLPIIIGYEDVDLSSNLPFVMRVSNDNMLINFLDLESFYLDTKSYRLNGDITEFMLNNLTWDKKIEDLIEFMETFN